MTGLGTRIGGFAGRPKCFRTHISPAVGEKSIIAFEETPLAGLLDARLSALGICLAAKL